MQLALFFLFVMPGSLNFRPLDPTVPLAPLISDGTPVQLRLLFRSNGSMLRAKCERSQCSNIHIAQIIAHAPAPFHPSVDRFQ
jgi:hypothetical protein